MALWWSCALGLLCMSTFKATANTEALPTATQTPSSTSEKWLNSSISIVCSFSFTVARGVTFFRRFDHNQLIFLKLREGDIRSNNTEPSVKGRVNYKKIHSQAGLVIEFTLSQLQVDDTDLYSCSWVVFEDRSLKMYTSNGSIVIVKKELTPERDNPRCSDDTIEGIILMALSISSIPLALCILSLSVLALCKRFSKKFTPSRSVASSPARRPLPPPPGCPTYSYLSVSHSFSHEFFHREQLGAIP